MKDSKILEFISNIKNVGKQKFSYEKILMVIPAYFLIHVIMLFLSLKRKKFLPKNYCNQP